MRLTNEELRDLYQHDTARAGRGQAECLTSELMVRAAAGELDSSERGQVADHVMSCSDCAREYRSLLPLRSWADAAAASVSEPPAKTKFATVRQSVLLGTQRMEKTGAAHLGWGQRLGGLFFSSRVPYAVAALLLVLSFALIAALIFQRRENQRLLAQLNDRPAERPAGTVAPSPETLEEMRRQLEEATRRTEREEAARAAAQEEVARRSSQENMRERPSRPTGRDGTEIAELRRTVKSLSQPQVNVPIIDVDPQGSSRAQSQDAPATIEVPSGANLFTLILNVAGEAWHSSYALEISNQRGATVWRGRGLHKSPYNTFTVALPRRSFPTGRYRIKLYGLRDGQRQLVEDYAVRVQYR